MRNTFLLLMVLVFTSTFFVACETDDTDEQLKVSALVPIKLGNTWTYRETHKVYQYSNELHVDTFSQTVVGPFTVNGVDYFSIEDSEENFERLGYRYLFGNDDHGNFMMCGGISSTDTLIMNSLYLKKNATVGESLTATVAVFDDDDQTFKQRSETFKCVSTDQLITTPRGMFSCKVFENRTVYEGLSEEQFYLTRVYVSSSIGIVKVEDYELGELSSTRELISFQLH